MTAISRAVLFDLDGVLVDTAQFHLAAWRRIADELGFGFDDDVAESLKGVGRDAALQLVLRAGGASLEVDQAAATTARKNRYYNDYLDTLGADALLPGASDALRALHRRRVPVALASASRNARTILERTGIEPYFDAVVDGNVVTRPKPDPAVFLTAADLLGVPPAECLVLEDAVAGIAGARAAGCAVIGVGDPAVLSAADAVVGDLTSVDWSAVVAEPAR